MNLIANRPVESLHLLFGELSRVAHLSAALPDLLHFLRSELEGKVADLFPDRLLHACWQPVNKLERTCFDIFLTNFLLGSRS